MGYNAVINQCAKTSTFTVDDTGDPEPITVTIECRKIIVGPVDGSSTYNFRAPMKSSSANRRTSGKETVIERPSPGQYQVGSYGDPGNYKPGDVVGFLETVSGVGSKTFQMQEYL